MGRYVGVHDLIMVFRTIVLYILGLFAIRVLGKRAVGQLSPFDFLIAVIIGSAVAIPMEDEKIPLIHGVIPIITILLINFFQCWIIKKNRAFEDIVQGKSTVLVKDGQILLDNLNRERITLADLLMLLRNAEIEQIDEVQEAVIEPNGKLSLIKKAEFREVTINDLKIAPPAKVQPLMTLAKDEVKNRYDVDLNTVLDAFVLGLNDEETAQVTKSAPEDIKEIRERLGQVNKRIGLTISEKNSYIDTEKQ